MRLWSLHPKYLDAKGLVALWREGLLALHVLQGKTKGYKHHPQLERFRASGQPIQAINAYLEVVLHEAVARGYQFDASKICPIKLAVPMTVTKGQLAYEYTHLKKKLWLRDRKRYTSIKDLKKITPHPLFKVVSGEIESWERI